ncbi:MAG: glycosyltransferase [Candidatus Binatia bacterium]
MSVPRPLDVCFLTEGSARRGLSPAARFRVLQYLPHFATAGIRADVRPSLPSKYFAHGRGMRRVHDWLGHRLATWVARQGYRLQVASRLRDIHRARRADVVVLQRDLQALDHSRLDEQLLYVNDRIVFDFDDAIWAKPSWERTGPDDDLVHHGLHEKIRRLLAMASHVVTSTPFLADFARQHNPHVTVIPTPVDTERYRPDPAREPDALPVIGWMGTSGNLHFLQDLVPALERLATRHRFVFRVVCNDVPALLRPRLHGARSEFRVWRLADEIRELQQFDVGLMPLHDDTWTRGKAGFKLVTYLACGVASVASPVGFNPRVLGPAGACGFYASTSAQWEAALEALLADAGARRALGARARVRAQAHFDVRDHARRWLDVLHEVAAS